jgi:hypothetical protein
MTTPDEFLSRVFAAADEAALFLAGTPPDLQAEWLQKFGYSVHSQWSEVFGSYLTPRDVDGMVIDVVERIRRRRDFLERFGRGTA